MQLPFYLYPLQAPATREVGDTLGAMAGNWLTVVRIARFQQFKAFEKRILVATDIFGRGIDVERVNVVINYVRLNIRQVLHVKLMLIPVGHSGGRRLVSSPSWSCRSFRNQGSR
jgi:hypothetical protein